VVTELRLRLVADPALLAPARRAIRGWAEQNQVGGERVERLLLACGEALANSIEHTRRVAGRAVAAAALGPSVEAPITLDLRLDAAGRIVAEIRDRGPWREPGAGSGARLRGRGLALMRRAMGRVEVVRAAAGTVVTLTECDPTDPDDGPVASELSGPGARVDP
jgi:serine/threonine-protein kinase RsbW